MKRRAIYVLLLVALLAGLLAITTTVVRADEPTPTPVPEVPTQSLGEEPTLVDRGIGILKKGVGFVQGLKRAGENVWNILTNPEKRASSALDLLAQAAGGGSGGLEELARKFEETDLFIPRFEEAAVWEKFALALLEIAWKLALLAIPVYFLSRVFGLRRQGLVAFTISWFVLIFILASDRLMWEAMSLVFRILISSIGGESVVADFKIVVDAVFKTITDNPAMLVPAIASLGIAGIALWVALVRYLITLLNLIIFRVITAIRMVRDLGFGRALGAAQWFGQTAAMFLELSLFWIIARLMLKALADPARLDIAWLLVAPAAVILVFTPAWISEGLFRRLAAAAAERVGAEPPPAPPTLAERRTQAGARIGTVAREGAQFGLGALSLGLDISQQSRIETLERERQASRGGSRSQRDQAQTEAFQRHAQAVEQGRTQGAGVSSESQTAERSTIAERDMRTRQRLINEGLVRPQAEAAGVTPAQRGDQPEAEPAVATTRPPGRAQPAAEQPTAGRTRSAVAAGTVATAGGLLKQAGIKVAPKTLTAMGAKAATALGSISAPVAITAAVLAGLVAAGAAELWVIAKQVSSHVKRYRRISDYVGLSVEAAVEAERQAQARRLAAATVRRPDEGGES